ncbi:hypothetical protein AMECASPLE_020958 [Ameca splendens]|uniref:Dymeclin n=1 Tax=Ameca splendens TaxID=208324 RepID=A0ABV0XSC1_9TELE
METHIITVLPLTLVFLFLFHSGDSRLLEEAVIPLAKTLIQNNPRTGNCGALVRVFLGRTKELKISTECQDQLFIWQAHNALFMIRCLVKVFIREMSEEELHQQFSYQERAPGSCGETGSEDLLEELLLNLVHLIVEVPLLDITYSILFEAVTTLLIFFSYQLFHKDILRDGLIYKHIMKGRCLELTSRLVKTLLYNFIRQEKCPPPAAHMFEPKAEGGLLYGLASGVANSYHECEEPQTRPPGPRIDTEEIRAKDIQRTPRAQEHQENHCRDYRNPQRGAGESPRGTTLVGGRVPHHAPATTQTHHITASATIAQSSTPPRPPCWGCRAPCWSPTPPQPTDRQPTDQAPKPGTEIQGNPNDPERAEKPAPAPDNPQDPNLNPSPDPDQKARSLSWPPTPDGKQQTGE